MADELLDLDATAQAEHLRRGDVTSSELLEACIARIENGNATLNAVIHPLFDKARATVAEQRVTDGPFAGVPFLVKDAVCHTAGDPYHLGMRALKEFGFTAKTDTELARRFRAAGFVFVGKTNTPELALSVTTEPIAYGATHNPWDTAHSTGGSSGGSAAAVAARWVPAAHANDMGGSIRVPASHCGLVGLKPSRGRSTLAPGHGEFWGPLTHEHVVTRSVRDSAAILDAIAGPAPGDPYTAPPPSRPFLAEVGAEPGTLRVGVLNMPAGLDLDAENAKALADTAKMLEARGHELAEVDLPTIVRPEGGPWIGAAVARELDRVSEWIGRPLQPDDVEPFNWMMAEMGRSLNGAQYTALAERAWLWVRDLCESWVNDFDVLLMPTCAAPPPKLGFLAPDVEPARLGANMAHYTVFTMPFNLTGEPAISLPVHVSEQGLPVGVQVVARYGREDVLFRLAAQVETDSMFESRRPGQ
jgi:amidase